MRQVSSAHARRLIVSLGATSGGVNSVEDRTRPRTRLDSARRDDRFFARQPTGASPHPGNEPVADFPGVVSIAGKFELKCSVLQRSSDDQHRGRRGAGEQRPCRA